MRQADQVRHRLRLGEGFLHEARQDLASQRWRSCADNSQLAVENAAKSFLAFLGPVGRSHNPAVLLEEALQGKRFPEEFSESVRRMISCAKKLGPKVHVQTDYGDEESGRTPWELFDEHAAREALETAEEAGALARALLGQGEPS